MLNETLNSTQIQEQKDEETKLKKILEDVCF